MRPSATSAWGLVVGDARQWFEKKNPYTPQSNAKWCGGGKTSHHRIPQRKSRRHQRESRVVWRQLSALASNFQPGSPSWLAAPALFFKHCSIFPFFRGAWPSVWMCGYTGYVGGKILESLGKHPRVSSCLECYHLFSTRRRHISTTQGVSLSDIKIAPNLYSCNYISIDRYDKKFKMQLTHQNDCFCVIRSDPL